MNNDFFQKKQVLFLSFLIGINAAFFGFLLLSEILPSLKFTNILFKFFKISLFFIFLILNIFIFLFYRYFGASSTVECNLVRDKMKMLSNDLNSLANAISELSRGNMVMRATLSSESIKTKSNYKSAGLVNLYNQIFNDIRDSIQDFNTITNVPFNRLLYIGADSFREGEKCGIVMGELLNGSGQVAVLLNKMTLVGQLLRYKGFQSSLKKKYPNIRILGVWEEFEKVEETYKITAELIKNNSNLTGIYICEGTTPEGVARAVKDAGKIGKIKVVSHDLSDPTMEYLENDIINATLSQNPYVQGYDPIVHLYNYLIDRKKPPINRKLTLLNVVTLENYKVFWNSRQGMLISEKTVQSLSVPVDNKLSKKFKIAVILPDDKLFWKPVAQGARAAAEKLLKYGVEVKCIIPKAVQNGERGAEVFIPVIENLLKEQIDALSLPVFDVNLLPFLNKKIEEGLIVATYNSEPISFRGMIDNVGKHAQELLTLSENLAAGSLESNQATSQISSTMKIIFTGSKSQLEKLSETELNMQSLMKNIDKITFESKESSIAAEKTIKAARNGYEIVQKSRQAMQVLLKSTTLTTDIINVLNEDIIKIKNIIDIIENIASQTNILAINAAIQAAHAGKEGKGFSVVSTEIRDLSKKSTSATKNIRKSIQTILEGVEQATKSMTDSLAEVTKNADLSNEVETALNDILQASGENETKMKEIDSAVIEIQNMLDVFKESMNSLAKANRDNSKAVETITQSIDEVSHEVENISNMSQQLSDMSLDQGNLMSQFIIE